MPINLSDHFAPPNAAAALRRLGVEQPETLAPSTARFADGAHFRIEIPSVEGPRVLEAVLEAAREHDVVVNRVSQGSGAMLLTEHNLSFYQALMAGMRSSIASGTMDRFASAFFVQYASRE